MRLRRVIFVKINWLYAGTPAHIRVLSRDSDNRESKQTISRKDLWISDIHKNPQRLHANPLNQIEIWSGENIVRSPWRHGANTQNKAWVAEAAHGFILNNHSLRRVLLVDFCISIEYRREMTLIPSWCRTRGKDRGLMDGTKECRSKCVMQKLHKTPGRVVLCYSNRSACEPARSRMMVVSVTRYIKSQSDSI